MMRSTDHPPLLAAIATRDGNQLRIRLSIAPAMVLDVTTIAVGGTRLITSGLPAQVSSASTTVDVAPPLTCPEVLGAGLPVALSVGVRPGDVPVPEMEEVRVVLPVGPQLARWLVDGPCAG